MFNSILKIFPFNLFMVIYRLLVINSKKKTIKNKRLEEEVYFNE